MSIGIFVEDVLYSPLGRILGTQTPGTSPSVTFEGRHDANTNVAAMTRAEIEQTLYEELALARERFDAEKSKDRRVDFERALIGTRSFSLIARSRSISDLSKPLDKIGDASRIGLESYTPPKHHC